MNLSLSSPSAKQRPAPSASAQNLFQKWRATPSPIPHLPRQPIYALARPRRMKGCARGVLLWSLGFYVLAALAMNVFMDRWCPVSWEALYRLKWARLREVAAEAADRPLVVALGSSRLDGAFQAGRLDGQPGPDGRPRAAYNFGIPAAGPMHEYEYLRDMLDKGIRPRLLIVEFLPPMLVQPHSHLISEEQWIKPEWMSVHQFRRLAPYLARPGRKASEWLLARLAPWYIHRSSLTNWLTEQLHPELAEEPVPYPHDPWGCRCPQTLTPQQRAFRMAVAREYSLSLSHFRLGEGPARAMRDLLACCRREDIPVVLILTPESSEFRSWYSPACRTATRQLLDELRTEYGVEVIDATCWLDDDDFFDGHHHDVSGATKFTTRLLAEVQRMVK
jgi:hypothetical protein